MKSDTAYAIEKLRELRSTMAVLPGRIHERLISAASILAAIQPERDFPIDHQRHVFDLIHADMTAVQDGEKANGTIANSVNAMTDDEAVDIATRLMDLLDELEISRNEQA